MLTGIALFLLAVIALLAVPFTLKIRVLRNEAFQGDLTVIWLFGLIHLKIPLFQPGTPSHKDEKSQKKKHHKDSSADKKSNFIAVIRDKRFRGRISRFAGKTWRAVRKENLRLYIRLGLGDPADTGELWGIVGPMAGVLKSLQGVSIGIEPEFMENCFELDGGGTIRIIPLQIIGLVIGLLLSPAIWRGILQMRATT